WVTTFNAASPGLARPPPPSAMTSKRLSRYSASGPLLAIELQPALAADGALPIPPCHVQLDRLLQRLVTAVIGVVQGELLQLGELALDPVPPRGVGRRQVELDLVPPRPRHHLGLEVRPVVVQHDVQRLPLAVAPPEPLQEVQERRPGLPRVEAPQQLVTLQV